MAILADFFNSIYDAFFLQFMGKIFVGIDLGQDTGKRSKNGVLR